MLRRPMDRTSDRSNIERAREAVDLQHWSEAFALLRDADQVVQLEGQDLEHLAFAARLLGHGDREVPVLERAHAAYLGEGETLRAARVTFWLTMALLERGELARSSGWFARGRRLVDETGADCAERGYLLLPAAFQSLAGGDADSAEAMFAEAIAIGRRYADADLMALGRMSRGKSLLSTGNIVDGLAVLDEVMVDITTGEVSLLVVGIVYCMAIEVCDEISELRRAHEWTDALTRWCDQHPEIAPFRGQCLVYRSEIMRLHGAWNVALEEARRAEEILSQPPPHPSLGSTLYQQAEVYRLRGEYPAAEEAYRQANRWGRHPEPGLALLRLAQGHAATGMNAIRLALEEAQDRPTRSRLLPAYVELALATGDRSHASVAATELADIAEALDAPLLRAHAAKASGEVLLEQGQPLQALTLLRQALSGWQSLDVPYETARVRLLISRACRDLGDMETAELEIDAARWVFQQLGARSELARLSQADGKAPAGQAAGLTAREREVLALIASGKTNREIAAELVISEKTVARHVSNILGKLDLPSRSAATAYAYERGLV